MATSGHSNERLSFPLLSEEENVFEMNVCHKNSSYFEHQYKNHLTINVLKTVCCLNKILITNTLLIVGGDNRVCMKEKNYLSPFSS